MADRIERRGEVVTGETLHLQSNDVIFECRMIDCELRIDRPRAATFLGSTFVNTTLKVTGTSTESWNGCFFDSCTFQGKYYSCLFGNTNDQYRFEAGLRTCDFTGATLNLCSFLNCTPDDLRLPGWPHATIFSPRTNAADFADLATDPVLASIHSSMGNTSTQVVAVIYNIPAYCKQSRQGILERWEVDKLFAKARANPEPPEPVISPDAIRALLQQKPYVFM